MDENEKRIRALGLWSGLSCVLPLHGGVSNASFKVIDQSGQYVVRIGDDFPFHQVSRAREAIASSAAFQIGLSPELVLSEKGLIVLRFIEGRTFGEADVRAHLGRCLELVHKCHRDMKRHITGQGAIFWVFQILRDYAATLKRLGHARISEVPQWMKHVDELEEAQVPLPIVFGHHDLLPTNFVDDGQRLWLIDWEYAAFGTAMFDLANLASNNSFDAALDREMLDGYFGAAMTPEIARSFAAMKAASALREAMWGMVSELHLSAPGVDYVGYAATYLARFHTLMRDFKEKYPS